MIEQTEQKISTINPRAILFRTVNAEVNMPLPEAPIRRTIVSSNCHFHFETLSFKLAEKTKITSIQKLFDGLSKGKFGRVVRAKALIQTSDGPYRFDITFGKVDEALFEREITDSRLVIIGEGLHEKDIAKITRQSE
jgi:G3E family GTPase